MAFIKRWSFMKKKEIVRDKRTFNNIIQSKNYIKNNIFVIYSQENNINEKRFGIAISKKNGTAVWRNKIKRQIKMIIDQNKFLFKNSRDYIIMLRRDVKNITYQELLINLIKLQEKGD